MLRRVYRNATLPLENSLTIPGIYLKSFDVEFIFQLLFNLDSSSQLIS
jgi:hypothetical protein